ncbi:hypothetical protein LINPERHAP2_LOCUS22696 [Linum perenne]
MLSLLPTGKLPSKTKASDIEDLVEDSRFYNIEPLLIDLLSHPSHFEAFNLEKSMLLPLNGRDYPSSIATTPSGTLHVAHIAARATDFSGLQILDMERGLLKETLNWENLTKSRSTVQAIGSTFQAIRSSPGPLLTRFESSRRNSNCIMVYDMETFKPVTEIGHYEIYGANLGSAIPATKLKWVASYNMVMASGLHSGPSSRLVGESSGEVFYMDLRKLGNDEDDSSSSTKWVCLGDERKVGNVK